MFLGREISRPQEYSQETAGRIDSEVTRFVLTNYDRARTLLVEHKVALLKIADELLAREVLDADQVRRLVKGQELAEHVPTATAATGDTPRAEAPDRPGIVPPIPKPITQA